jgi:imidazolonepropionase
MPYVRLNEADAFTAEPGGVLLREGRIAAADALGAADADVRIDAQGAAVIPGFVDCHTHLPFAGWRAEEYAMKVAGADYAQLAAQGGGIAASARALAQSSDEQVLALARALAREMLEHGTTTFECKSGYGLSEREEMRSLALAGRLAELVAQRTTSTALLAHAVPPGWEKDRWMALVRQLAPVVDASALDIFVEAMAFDLEDLTAMGQLAHASGKALRAHVEQFTTMRSVPVALDAGARSLDHLVALHAEDLPRLAAAECAAVLLPAAELLGDEGVAPGRALADAGAICALASDANPGTSPVVSMPLVIALAVRRYRWTILQALAAATLNAAWVLELSAELGSLEDGKHADVLVLDGPIEHIAYRLGHNPVAVVILGGEIVHVRPDQSWRLS